jgi:soluble lytic murein transglycosylase
VETHVNLRNGYIKTTLSVAAFRCKAALLRGAAALAVCAALSFPAWANNVPVTATAAPVEVGRSMDADDRAATIKAIRLIDSGQWTKGGDMMRATGDPLASKLYAWLAYTRDYGTPTFEVVARFVRENPDWPKQGKLQLTAEKAMPEGLPLKTITEWFDHYPPQTSDGMDMYLRALLHMGKMDAVTQVLRGWWPKASLSADQQAKFIERYSKWISVDMQAARVNALILRKQYTNARTIARRLGRGYPQLVEARIALAEQAAGVNGAIAAVPPHLKDDPGLLYERLRWRRRNDEDAGAIEILHKQPSPDKIPNLADWWTERNTIIRRLIERKQYQSAYLLAAGHRQSEGVPYVEAEFLAGWLALSFLKEPWKAFEHFERLYNKAETPISKARGAYWAGRASEKLGHKDIATQWYRTAARHQTVFYGQMAVSALAEEQKPPQQVPPERTVRGEAAFITNELTQVAKMMHEAGEWKETTTFLDALGGKAQTPETVMLAAELAKKLEHHHNAVKIAKKALQNGIMITDYAYPTLLSYMKGVDTEWALVHGLIRQESQFDMRAQSPVGARGLMQLMPATAAETAKKAGMPHQLDWLVSRPSHNIALGSRYINQMVRRYDGNYALALAAYNAGPGRVDKWLKAYGDPRTGQIDLIDWIEMIPYTETRNYVQRVLESVYVYRLKLRDVQKSVQSPIHVSM